MFTNACMYAWSRYLWRMLCSVETRREVPDFPFLLSGTANMQTWLLKNHHCSTITRWQGHVCMQVRSNLATLTSPVFRVLGL